MHTVQYSTVQYRHFIEICEYADGTETLWNFLTMRGHAVSRLVELRYMAEDAGSIPNGVTGFFH